MVQAWADYLDGLRTSGSTGEALRPVAVVRSSLPLPRERSAASSGSVTKRRVRLYRGIYLAQAQPQMLATWTTETRHLKKCSCRVLWCLRGYTSCRFRNA